MILWLVRVVFGLGAGFMDGGLRLWIGSFKSWGFFGHQKGDVLLGVGWEYGFCSVKIFVKE